MPHIIQVQVSLRSDFGVESSHRRHHVSPMHSTFEPRLQAYKLYHGTYGRIKLGPVEMRSQSITTATPLTPPEAVHQLSPHRRAHEYFGCFHIPLSSGNRHEDSHSEEPQAQGLRSAWSRRYHPGEFPPSPSKYARGRFPFPSRYMFD